jgi:integrase
MGRRRKPTPRQVTIIRYETADGKRCNKDTPGAVRIKTLSDMYYWEVKQKGQKPERIPLATDLGEAWLRLDERIKEREWGKSPDGRYALEAAKPLEKHLDDWLTTVADGGATAKRVGMMRARVLLLAELSGWKRIDDVRKSSALAGLAALQQRKTRRAPDGASNQTRNHYASHARQFTAWLFDEHRIRENPLTSLKDLSVEGHLRHARRCPEDGEVVALFEYLALPAAKIRRKMDGEQRALGYQVSMCTGLRAAELRALTLEHLDLRGGSGGTVRVQAKRAKSRKGVVMPLPAWLTLKLQAWIDAGGGLWENFPPYWPGRLLKDDLAAAGVAYQVDDLDGPTFFDFHALRHWYITQVADQPDISPSTLQALSRHSDPKLTLKIYAAAKEKGTREAADLVRMPERPPAQSEPSADPPAKPAVG